MNCSGFKLTLQLCLFVYCCLSALQIKFSSFNWKSNEKIRATLVNHCMLYVCMYLGKNRHRAHIIIFHSYIFICPFWYLKLSLQCHGNPLSPIDSIFFSRCPWQQFHFSIDNYLMTENNFDSCVFLLQFTNFNFGYRVFLGGLLGIFTLQCKYCTLLYTVNILVYEYWNKKEPSSTTILLKIKRRRK